MPTTDPNQLFTTETGKNTLPKLFFTGNLLTSKRLYNISYAGTIILV
jgi:hypothetical protein